MRVAGVDVGAERKGFHAVVLEDRRVIEGPLRLGGAAGSATSSIGWRSVRSCVAVDSPRRPAPRGEASRADERRFASLRVCGIRFTPDLATLERRERLLRLDPQRIPAIPRARRGSRAGWLGAGGMLSDRDLDGAPRPPRRRASIGLDDRSTGAAQARRAAAKATQPGRSRRDRRRLHSRALAAATARGNQGRRGPRDRHGAHSGIERCRRPASATGPTLRRSAFESGSAAKTACALR